ncbi:hypothetical protein [uncultured Thiohalocapsa sp.]|uniref:hypothetical protein n=1 Tax=uncultured Thiohalocapsa sp. TaxID=768990 RepID=UPI0025D62048|nr:hypothetical protein [uncultured Thiohalocapsa sp.]
MSASVHAIDTKPRTRADWAARITTAYAKTVESIVKTGAELLAAKDALPRGAFQKMVRRDLPFGDRTAQKLMAIARNPALTDEANWPQLPAAWTQLYELSRFEPDVIAQLVAHGDQVGKRLNEMDTAEMLLATDLLRRPQNRQADPAVSEAPTKDDARQDRAPLWIVPDAPSSSAPAETPHHCAERASRPACPPPAAAGQFEPVPDGELAFPAAAQRFSQSLASALPDQPPTGQAASGLEALKQAWGRATATERLEFIGWASKRMR